MDKIRHILERPKAKVAICIAFIVIITLIVYYPTFVHLLRAETFHYFADTAGTNSVGSLIANYYNFDKVRLVCPGDTLLFRPLLYVLLGIEKGLFGINYVYWNITTFLFHLITTLCLFRLLWKIKPGIIALLATLLFATSSVALRTVQYEVLTSYVICMALILTGFYYAYCGVKSGKKRHLIFALISMATACFLNEIAIPLSVLLIGYFWFERKQPNFNWKPWSFSFLALPFLYLAVYIPVKFINPSPLTSGELTNIIAWQGLITNMWGGSWTILGWWLSQSIFPTLFTIHLEPELALATFDLVQENLAALPIIFNSLAVVALVGVLYFAKVRKDNKGASVPFFFLLASSLVIILLAVVFFRAKTHGTFYLRVHNFSTYFWVALSIITAYALLSFLKLTAKHKQLIVLALIIFVSLSASSSLVVNYGAIIVEQPSRTYFQEIDNFIELHQDEQDFSFDSTFDGYPTHDLYPSKIIEGKEVLWPVTIPQLLYWDYWGEDNPKYSLTYHADEDWEGNRMEVINNWKQP